MCAAVGRRLPECDGCPCVCAKRRSWTSLSCCDCRPPVTLECATVEGQDKKKKKIRGQSIKTSPREHGVKTGARRVRDNNRFEWTLSLKREEKYSDHSGFSCTQVTCNDIGSNLFPPLCRDSLSHCALRADEWGLFQSTQMTAIFISL